MTAIALRPPGRIVRPAAILAALAAVVGLRWAATVSGATGAAGAIAIGWAFGAALLAVALGGGWRPASVRPSALAIGAAGGAVLVVLAVVIRAGPGPSLTPAVELGPWAAVTILVASAEEAVLRGALFDALDRRLGVGGAVLVTSAVFALMHVPLYGWHVVPLDFGVGLWLAGLRLATGGIAAPAVAHVIADLATWWL
jgi:membrane protease YdiL (CAAX protease family)